MPLSSLDLLSPKITLYFNGHNSHISHIGGLLSVLFLILIIVLTIKFLFDIINPKINSSFIYEQYSSNLKYNQTLDDSGINHFIQMYSHTNKGWFGEYDNKNLIIYGLKESNKIIYKEEDQTKIDLYNTEHWLYDKCENLLDIDRKLFSQISQIISNYTKSICLRYYYNPYDQIYHEIGRQGYISPYLETNLINEKRYTYKIIIEKCNNNTIFTNKMNFKCHNENEIMKYLGLYNDIFLHFSNNEILPKNKKNPFEKYFYSISSSIQKLSFFENNIIFSPVRLITERGVFNSKREDLSFLLKEHYHNDKLINEEYATIGIFNFYYRNNILIYHRVYPSFIDIFSHLGGIAELLFFIFQMFNYINNRYIITENSKTLFKINTGIDSSYTEGNELIFDKMRHLNSQNYKIKVFNNNNIINNDDFNRKFMKNVTSQNKKKSKYPNYEYHGFPLVNKVSKKNLGIMMPIPSINSNRKKNNNFDSKRTQTKYTNTFKQMGKQFTIKNKRKSYMSQGYLIKRVDHSICSKNQSINENDQNQEIISNSNNLNDNNNNSSFLLLKELKDKEAKEGFFKHDSKNIGEANITRRNIKKKTNLKKHQIDNIDGTGVTGVSGLQMQSTIKKIDPNIKGRHKSVNFGNQRDFLFSSNLLGIKNMFIGKNSSEYVNDSSKQIMVPNKSPIMPHNSKFQVEKNKFDDIISRPSIANNNDNNLNTIIYNNNNPNTENANFLKNIIQSKIKLIMPEVKQDYNLNNLLERKTTYTEFFKFFLICFKKKDNKLEFLNNFRNKLLSEEHLYKVHINLYLLEKIFQVDEVYKFNPNELYNNL